MSLKEGTYIWDIDDAKLLNKILNAKNEDIGSVGIYVTLLSLPTSWKSVIINRTIQCPQTKSSQTNNITCDESGKPVGCSDNTVRLQELKQSNINTLVFIIKIKILRIILKNDKILYHY
eukprot:121157_1